MSVLSVRIRQRREELGMSQEELAARMGYRSKSSITKIEKGGQRYPSEQDRGLCRRAPHDSRLAAGPGGGTGGGSSGL